MLTEISLHLPNRPGEFARVLKALTEGKVNVMAFTIDQAGAYSIVRLICHPLEKAIEQLNKYAYSVSQDEILAIPLPQEPGRLQPVVNFFGDNNINIEYGYLTFRPSTKQAIVLLKTDHEDKAKRLLVENGYEDLDKIL